MTFIDLQGHPSYICLKLSVAMLFRTLIESPGDLAKGDIADGLEWPLRIIWVRVLYAVVVCISKTQHIVI